MSTLRRCWLCVMVAVLATSVTHAAASALPSSTALDGASLPAFLNDNEHAFVAFYAPWCIHSQMMLDEFERAAVLAARDASPFAFATLDCVDDEAACAARAITAYPTLLAFSPLPHADGTHAPASSATPLLYAGNRTAEALVAFTAQLLGRLPLVAVDDVRAHAARTSNLLHIAAYARDDADAARLTAELARASHEHSETHRSDNGDDNDNDNDNDYYNNNNNNNNNNGDNNNDADWRDANTRRRRQHHLFSASRVLGDVSDSFGAGIVALPRYEAPIARDELGRESIAEFLDRVHAQVLVLELSTELYTVYQHSKQWIALLFVDSNASDDENAAVLRRVRRAACRAANDDDAGCPGNDDDDDDDNNNDDRDDNADDNADADKQHDHGDDGGSANATDAAGVAANASVGVDIAAIAAARGRRRVALDTDVTARAPIDLQRWGFLHADGRLYRHQLQLLGVSGYFLPSLLVLNTQTQKIHRFDELTRLRARNTSAALATFLRRVSDGSSPPYVLSDEAPQPEAQQRADLVTVVTSSFEKLVRNSAKEFFLMVYAPWCAYCKEIMEQWQRLGWALNVVRHTPVAVGVMDGSSQHLPLEVDAFPSLLFFSTARRDEPPLVYDGVMDFDHWMAFVRRHAGQPFSFQELTASELDDYNAKVEIERRNRYTHADRQNAEERFVLIMQERMKKKREQERARREEELRRAQAAREEQRLARLEDNDYVDEEDEEAAAQAERDAEAARLAAERAERLVVVDDGVADERGPDGTVCRHWVVNGRVQRVSFRKTSHFVAKQLGLKGWVRNVRDGSVKTLACGAANRLDLYAEYLTQGPRMAKVQLVRQTAHRWLNFGDFLVRKDEGREKKAKDGKKAKDTDAAADAVAADAADAAADGGELERQAVAAAAEMKRVAAEQQQQQPETKRQHDEL